MIHLPLRLHPALPALTLLLACVPFTTASSATVDDVVTALHAQDDARAQALLEALKAQGLGGAYEVRFLQGVLHLRAGEEERAARVFDDLEASEGPAPALASGQALSAWAAGRYGEARTRLEHAVQLWPEDPGVWANLGDVYRALAARAYQRVRVLRRNAGGDAPSPLAPDLSVQPGLAPPSDAPAPASSVLAIVPAETAGSRAPAAGSAGTTESAVPVEPVVPAESTAPADSATSAAGPVTPAGSTTSAAGPATPAGSTTSAADPVTPADSATSAAGPVAPADSAAPAEPAAPAEARIDSITPTGSAPSSDPAVPSSPSPSVASSPPSPVLTPEASPSAASFPLPSSSTPGDVLSVPVSAPAAAPAGSVECFLAGPWPDVPPAEVLEWLQVRNAQDLSFQSRSPLYRVYLGPFDDRKRAVQAMVSLKKDLGIDDVAWVPSGPLRDAVSLGTYMKRESVDRRLRALHALGLDPKVQLPQAGSWLRGSTSDLQTIRTDWSRTFPNVALTPERCPPSP